MMIHQIWKSAVICIAVLFAITVFADSFDTPDSVVNPQSGDIEIVDPVWSGTNQDINYVINPDNGNPPNVYEVATHSLDDRNPKVANAGNGDAWIAWWRDDATDQVLVRKRHHSDGSWDGERVLSDAAESSRNPSIAHDATGAWVAFEFDGQNDSGIGVSLVIDEPDPIGLRSVVGTTTYTGPLDVRIRSAAGNLWITWVDSATDLGWVEYDPSSETWTLPAYESYAQDSMPLAQGRIRSTVMGN